MFFTWVSECAYSNNTEICCFFFHFRFPFAASPVRSLVRILETSLFFLVGYFRHHRLLVATSRRVVLFATNFSHFFFLVIEFFAYNIVQCQIVNIFLREHFLLCRFLVVYCAAFVVCTSLRIFSEYISFDLLRADAYEHVHTVHFTFAWQKKKKQIRLDAVERSHSADVARQPFALLLFRFVHFSIFCCRKRHFQLCSSIEIIILFCFSSSFFCPVIPSLTTMSSSSSVRKLAFSTSSCMTQRTHTIRINMSMENVTQKVFYVRKRILFVVAIECASDRQWTSTKRQAKKSVLECGV